MKQKVLFKVFSEEMKNILLILQKGLDSNPVIPIMENFLIVLKAGGGAEVRSTDLNVFMVSDIAISHKEEKEFLFCVPALTLIETLKSIAPQNIEFQITGEKKTTSLGMSYSILLKANEGKYKMSGYDGDDFPSLPNVGKTSDFSVEFPEVSKSIEKALYCCGVDEMRPQFTGVNFSFAPDGLELCSTDSAKMYVEKIQDIKSDKTMSCIIPSAALRKVLSTPMIGDVVSMKIGSSYALLQMDDVFFYIRLIDHKFVDYHSIIPTEKQIKHKFRVDSLSLRSILRVVGKFSDPAYEAVFLDLIKDTGAKIYGSHKILNLEAYDIVEGEVDGEDGFRIAFPYKMMSGILSKSSGEVEVQFSSKNTPMLIRSDDSEGIFLLMPNMVITHSDSSIMEPQEA